MAHRLLGALFTLLLAASPAQAYDIVTGGKSGTYIQIGRNIGELVKQFNVDLKAVESAGSIENVNAVYKRPVTPLGIVQSDVLGWIAVRSNDPELRNIAAKTRLVFPLYNEEVHVLARKGVASLADLNGKRVAIGRAGSGSELTATMMLATAGITPAETINIGAEEALARLKAGTLDAMVYVAGYPVKLLSDQVGSGDGLHLLPIDDPALLEFYPASEIPAGTYGWQASAVPVIAVKATLMTYDFPQTSQYLRNSCAAVAKVARAIRDNIDWLRANGHPKWRQVDLDFQVPGWTQSTCVRDGLDSAKPDLLVPTSASPAGGEACKKACQAEENPVRRSLCEIKCLE
ncbi:MAG: TAXI family TRAP transporter solute-binding subunit [Pseudomonadota bacterium]